MGYRACLFNSGLKLAMELQNTRQNKITFTFKQIIYLYKSLKRGLEKKKKTDVGIFIGNSSKRLLDWEKQQKIGQNIISE